MKKTTIMFFILFVSSSLFAQTTMKVRKTDNSIISIPISDIDSVYYEINNFTCGEQVSDIDGNLYPTVQIGEQCWFAEDLRVTHYSNNIEIPHIIDDVAWENLENNNTDDAYCFNIYSDCGALYTWAAAMGDNAVSSDTNPSGVQGVCPNGWHLPSDLEWTELTMFLGGLSVAGGKMKEIGTIHWSSPNTGATNESGLSATAGGLRGYDGVFYNLGYTGRYWSSSESDGTKVFYCHLSHTSVEANRYEASKSNGYSVRCIMD